VKKPCALDAQAAYVARHRDATESGRIDNCCAGVRVRSGDRGRSSSAFHRNERPECEILLPPSCMDAVMRRLGKFKEEMRAQQLHDEQRKWKPSQRKNPRATISRSAKKC